ncbi:MAG: hypothetical protein WC969_08955 [Elusimicrobiota bacterium]|jgi:hypothetical protein
MANSELIRYIRENLAAHGEQSVREHLIDEGLSPEEIEAAFAEMRGPAPFPRRPRGKNAVYGIFLGVAMIAVAAYIALDRPANSPDPVPAETAAPPQPSAQVVQDGDAFIFNGHYGYMVKLPAGYQAEAGFLDPEKRHEVVHLYPTGTNPTNFIHEGLYGALGILRIEAVPRRTPGGVLGLDTLRAIAQQRLQLERAQFTVRAAVYNGLNASVFSVTQPFAQAKAYLVGQKVYYIVTTGADDERLNGLLETLVEVSPHDNPGR